MNQVEKILEQAMSLVILDQQLYEELYEWGVFFNCSISPSDLQDKTYQCAILRMKEGLYSGVAIFEIKGSQTQFLYMELIRSVRGRGLGTWVFHHAVLLLNRIGIHEVFTADTLSDLTNDYLQGLGFVPEINTSYLEYDYYTLVNSNLYQQIGKLANWVQKVQPGLEVPNSLKKDFLRLLRKKGQPVSEDVFFGENSIFYISNGEIYGYIGIRVQSENLIYVLDKGFIKEKDNGVDVRVPLLGKILEYITEHVDDKQSFQMLFVIDDPVIEQGMINSIGFPGIQKRINAFKYYPV